LCRCQKRMCRDAWLLLIVVHRIMVWKVIDIAKNSIEIGWLFGSKSKPQSFATSAESRYLDWKAGSQWAPATRQIRYVTKGMYPKAKATKLK
jgi:hypothetical protein